MSNTEVARRPASGSPSRSNEPSPPRMMVYAEKREGTNKDRSLDGKHVELVQKFTLDWMGQDAPSDEYLRQMFEFFDVDNSGSLDKAEFRKVYTQSFENYGAPVEERDMERIFAKVDRNRNGKLSYDEFCVLILSRLKM